MNDRNNESNRQRSGTDGLLGNFEARTQLGDCVTDHAQLKGDDLVIIPGAGETLLSVALEAGLIVRGADGKLRAVTEAEHDQAAQQAEQQQQEQADRDAKENKGEPADAQTESWLKEATSSPERGNATFDLGSDLIASGGELTDTMVAEFAQAQNIAPTEARARVAHVQASYSLEAARSVEKETDIPAAVAAKALYEARSDSTLQRLAMEHFTSGKPRGYAPYVLAHVAAMDSTEEGKAAILAANPGTVRIGTDGNLVVRLDNGMETGWADAVYAKYSRRR